MIVSILPATLERGLHQFPSLRLAQEMPGATEDFNCLSWALGFTDRWLWPRDDSMDGMRTVLEGYGFEWCLWDDRVEDGVEKVILYAIKRKVMHVARQEPDGTWSSKLGDEELVTHPDVEELEGPCYGEAREMYRRNSAD